MEIHLFLILEKLGNCNQIFLVIAEANEERNHCFHQGKYICAKTSNILSLRDIQKSYSKNTKMWGFLKFLLTGYPEQVQ